jgi:hypothetical protein
LAVNAAWGQSLEYEAAYAKLLTDTINHTGDLAADTQKVADIVGGPMADAYGKAAAASAQMAAAQVTITQLTDAHNQVVQQRAAADQASSRAATEAGWAQQDATALMQQRQQAAQNRLADKTTGENTAWTGQSRAFDDQIANLQHYGTARHQQLTQEQVDLQAVITSQQQYAAAQKINVAGNLGLALATGGPNAARDASARQAITGTTLANQADAASNQLTAINKSLVAEDKLGSDQLFNLQQQKTAAERVHQDRLAGFAAEGTAQQRTFAREQLAESQHQQAIARSTQLQQWQEQDKRQAEDAAYKAAVDAATAQGKVAQASLDTANQALSVWQQTGVVIQSAATAAQNNYAASPAYTRTLGTHSAGGVIPMTEPYSIVGDGPGGQITPYTEIVSAPGYTVTPVAPLLAAAGGKGGGVTINIAGDTIFSDAEIARITRFVEQMKAEAIATARASVATALRGRGGLN